MARAIFTTLLLLTVAFERPASADEPVEVTLQLHPEHLTSGARIRDAATEAIHQYTEWFGPAPFDRLTIATVPAGTSRPPDQPGWITVAAHWRQAERSLLLEADVTRAVARQWWGIAVALPDQWLADGIADYAQSRTVEQIYDRRLQRLAYSTYEARFFGGIWPWAIRALRLDRYTAGVGRAEYRRHPDVDLRGVVPELRQARAAKIANGLLTLERYIGWPALQRGLSLASARYRSRPMTADEFARTISDAADSDLSWFFDQLFNQTTQWDYAVASMATAALPNATCGSGPCLRSTIVIQRLGSATFSGTAHPPAGEFESGRAIEIAVGFADGQQVVERWDGRRESKTLTFDAPSAVVRATVDPRGVLALDVHQLNNAKSIAPVDGSTTMAWSVRWTIWLQDLLLTHAMLY